MTKDRIIADLFKSEEFNSCIAKMKPEQLQDDLKSEVMLILLESSDQKIIDLYQAGGLKFYTVRIILNLIQSNTSPFFKKFRQQSEEIKGYELSRKEFKNNDQDDIVLINNGGDSYNSIQDLLLQESESNQEYAGQVFSILERREKREEMEDQAIAEIDKLYWYDRELVKLYLKHGNYRAIEQETNIPWESVYKTIQKAFKRIKLKVTGV